MEILGIVTVSNWVLILLFMITSFYIYLTWHFNFFKKRGIKGATPYPLIGTMGPMLRKGIFGSLMNSQKLYGKVNGGFIGRQPVLAVQDVDMLKQILVKEFPVFTNRRPIPCRGIMKKSVFDARGKDWKRIRNFLTPAFTSGKMRQMDSIIKNNADTLLKNFEDIVKNGGNFEAKEYMGAYTMDVIASTGFGIAIDSQKDKNNPFVINARKILDLSITSILFLVILFCEFMVPILEWCNVSMFKPGPMSFFDKITTSSMEQKRDERLKRVDILQLMMDAGENIDNNDSSNSDEKTGLTKDEITAQSTILFIAGYDTTATTMSFFLYSMATNPDVQEKLVEEIELVRKEHGEPCYDSISKMTYLDMCISETLRIYPPLSFLDREASQDIAVNGVDIQAGLGVSIPIYALHHDPEIWPEPERFDPERFSADAKASRDQFHYLPFGLGPRQCIGMRLAQMEMKIALAKLLSKFKIISSEKTEVPLQLKKFAVLITAENGIHLTAEFR